MTSKPYSFSFPDLKPGVDEMIRRFLQNLKFGLGKDQFSATPFDCYTAFSHTIRDYLVDRWCAYQQSQYALDAKRVYYLSLEFLIGRSLGNAILNLDLATESANALERLGFDLSLLSELEWDAGLGNGGLGRLAACFLDSLACLGIPAYGYGIRYEYGIFMQHIKDGYQIETPDNWLRYGSPWEIGHSEHLFPVRFGGSVEFIQDAKGRHKARWNSAETVMAMAYDILIPGYRNDAINTLRLWSAKSSRDFNLNYFNQGDYINSVADKNHSEMISKVLYPKDDTLQGKELRLKQEYFFVSATLQDIIRRFLKKESDFRKFPDRVAIQLNDTHPAIAIADLMRILVDEKDLPWDVAWEITTKTFAYTNHTILPEALETWEVDLFGNLLPRHLQIIYEINHRFLNSISASTADISALSLIQESPVKAVRMANLAIHGSHSINGVSALHTDLLKTLIFPAFYALTPQKFNNKTNGITPRRWLKLANPGLSDLISDAIGDAWICDLDELERLIPFARDSHFCDAFQNAKYRNKLAFAGYLKSIHGFEVHPDSIFDFQTKRIHEYKRQLLNALHIIHLALSILDGERPMRNPHSFFFAGKAAPGYAMAKLIIKLITSIGDWISRQPKLNKQISVFFLPNYRVTLAERIMPAAEVSQQISMASTEASGTGNMKFALNGALTIGTLDGANIEIMEAVGQDNIYIFGLNASEIATLKSSGYNPSHYINSDPRLHRVIDFIASGALSPKDPTLFAPIVAELTVNLDRYCHLADFDDYLRVMAVLDRDYCNQALWTGKSILNVANMGRFSSDKVIQNYAREIWKI